VFDWASRTSDVLLLTVPKVLLKLYWILALILMTSLVKSLAGWAWRASMISIFLMTPPVFPSKLHLLTHLFPWIFFKATTLIVFIHSKKRATQHCKKLDKEIWLYWTIKPPWLACSGVLLLCCPTLENQHGSMVRFKAVLSKHNWSPTALVFLQVGMLAWMFCSRSGILIATPSQRQQNKTTLLQQQEQQMIQVTVNAFLFLWQVPLVCRSVGLLKVGLVVPLYSLKFQLVLPLGLPFLDSHSATTP